MYFQDRELCRADLTLVYTTPSNNRWGSVYSATLSRSACFFALKPSATLLVIWHYVFRAGHGEKAERGNSTQHLGRDIGAARRVADVFD